MFEGVEVNLPCDPDTYLRNLYGDYMQIPPVENVSATFIRSLTWVLSPQMLDNKLCVYVD